MKEVNLRWEDFVSQYENKKVTPYVDLNKGHALMKAPFAPSNWRATIKFMTWGVILSFPLAIILFFIVSWWIPLIIVVLSLMFGKAIRQESAKAVIKTSLEDSDFFYHAIRSGTMKLYIA